MDVDALHIVLATVIALAWLGIVFGWLCTCRHGDETDNRRNVDSPTKIPAPKNRPAA